MNKGLEKNAAAPFTAHEFKRTDQLCGVALANDGRTYLVRLPTRHLTE